jgi:hypothetical protein
MYRLEAVILPVLIEAFAAMSYPITIPAVVFSNLHRNEL